MANPLSTTWRHSTITDSGDLGVLQVTSNTPTGKHSITGGGWVGGPLNSTSTNGSDAVRPPDACYTDYDSGTDTTYWVCVFKIPTGGTERVHVWEGHLD